MPSEPSPIFPWEVIEAIIDECSGENKALCALALTCSHLCTRSRLCLLADVKLSSKDQKSQFQNAIQQYPHLRPFVRSLSMPIFETVENGLFPLLASLSHLRHLKLRQCCNGVLQPFETPSPRATHIQSLTITSFRFDQPANLHEFISIFPNLEHLTCEESLSGYHSSVPQGAQARANLRTLNILKGTSAESAQLICGVAQLLHTSGEAARTHRHFQTSITWWLSFSSWVTSSHNALELVRRLDHGACRITIVLWSSSILELYRICRRQYRVNVPPLSELLVWTSGHIYTTTDGLLRARKTVSWVDEVNRYLPTHATEICRWENVEYTSVPGHDGRVTALSISPDGRWVATASADRTIILWDANTACVSQEWIAHDGHIFGLAFSPDSRYLASTGFEDRKLVVWDITGSAHEIARDVVIGYPYGCAWSGDGAFIASTFRFGVLIWDAHTFKRLDSPPYQNPKHFSEIQISPDGRKLIAYNRVWDVQPGALLRLPTDDRPRVSRFSPCGSYIALSYLEGIRIRSIYGEESVLLPYQSPSCCLQLAFSPNGLLLLSVLDSREILIWDARTGALTQSLRGHPDLIIQAFFSPCGTYVASASRDKTVKMWNVRDGTCLATLHYDSEVERLAFTLDGTMLWVATSDGTVLARRVQDMIPEYCFVE